MKRICLAVIIALGATDAVPARETTAFPRPPELEPDIRFWTRVYTEVDTQGGLIHDARRLDAVYEVIRFPLKSGKRARQRYVKQVKRRYKRILLKLARGQRHRLTPEEKRVLALWPEDVNTRTLRAAAHRLRFQLGQADKFRDGLIRSGAWRAQIDQTFSQMGLPIGLGALPHVESSFNPAARSRAGAVGLWQFTRATGRRYLRIDRAVDERLDPFKSTVAAARLLKHNRDVTGNWPFAITAYNHGAAGVRRAARELGSNDIVALVRRYNSRTFGFASRNFYVAFLAAIEVESNAEKYFGSLELDRDGVKETEVVEAPAYLDVNTLERVLDVDRTTLRRLNPALRRSVWNGSRPIPPGYALRLPRHVAHGSAKLVLAQAATSERSHPRATSTADGLYRVQYGDSLSEIARRFGVDEHSLMVANGIRDKNRIYVGQTLMVATAPASAMDAAASASHANEPTRGPAQPQIGPDVAVQRNEVDVAKAEAAEPITAEEAEFFGPTLPVGVHPALSADPSDYLVGDDKTIEVQAAETLGHYAEWLELRASWLRDVNRMRYSQPLLIGQRLRLDFSHVSPEVFEQRRLAYHISLQQVFFQKFQITATSVHVMRRGERLWDLALREYDVPIWLIRQFNPDIDFHALLPGTRVTIPRVEPVPSAELDEPPRLRAA